MLVTVVLVSVVIWAVLAGLVAAVRLQHAVALAARDQRVAQAAAERLVTAARSIDWWGGAPTPEASWAGAGGIGGSAMCEWEVRVLNLSDERAWFEAEVRYGRAVVSMDATEHRVP